MNKSLLITATWEHVKAALKNDSTGHDHWHIYRVWKMAEKIAVIEKADHTIVALAALLHDIGDWKLQADGVDRSAELATQWLRSQHCDETEVAAICDIINNISFRGGKERAALSLEGQIVQDADRLDAIGAIGIARAFTYGGAKQRALYDPNDVPVIGQDVAQYKNNKTSTINHFYEKLLLLKDRMNTEAAKQIAQQRHAYMENFLREFLKEWEGV